MLVLKTKEMRDFDKHTLKVLGISEKELMFRAGYYLVKDFISRVKPRFDVPISIFAGIGNNGGDALVMASELGKLGYRMSLYVVGDIAKASDAFQSYLKDLTGYETIDSGKKLESILSSVLASSIIIDGIFGIGLTRDVSDYRRDLIDTLNSMDATIYAIDIPSGLDPETGLPRNTAVKADLTGIVGAYKLGNLLGMSLDYQGQTNLLDIGLVAPYEVNRIFVDVHANRVDIPILLNSINKYSKGSGVFIGGRDSMLGSIQMSAYAGMKSGLGIAFVDVKSDHSYTQFYPELIMSDVRSGDWLWHLGRAKVVVFGPGLPDNDPEYEKIFTSVIERNVPVVIDAGGLGYLDRNKDYHDRNIVVTPHAGELGKLYHIDATDINRKPLDFIKDLTDIGLTVVLKGQTTIIANDRNTIFVQARNPGLATAGSGDVLTGIIAGFLAHQSTDQAVLSAVAIHSKSALIATERVGAFSMTATDIISAIPESIKKEKEYVQEH